MNIANQQHYYLIMRVEHCEKVMQRIVEQFSTCVKEDLFKLSYAGYRTARLINEIIFYLSNIDHSGVYNCEYSQRQHIIRNGLRELPFELIEIIMYKDSINLAQEQFAQLSDIVADSIDVTYATRILIPYQQIINKCNQSELIQSLEYFVFLHRALDILQNHLAIIITSPTNWLEQISKDNGRKIVCGSTSTQQHFSF